MTETSPEPYETPPLWDDPVIDEVRAIRRRLWEAAGRDVHRFLEQTRQADARRRASKLSDSSGAE